MMPVPKTKLRSLATALLAFTLGTASADDIRIINANIITMDDSNPSASTMLISGNRIVAVGEEGVGGGDAEGQVIVIDAGGAVVLPGIIDQHLHWNRSAITWGYALHRGENAFTLQALEEALKARAAEVPTGEWISLIGRHNHLQFLADPSNPDSGRYPTRQELDAWAPEHNILFSQRFRPTPVGSGSGDFNRANFTGPGQLSSNAVDFFNAMESPMPFVSEVPLSGALDATLSNEVYEWTRANNTLEHQVRSTIDLVRWSHQVGLVAVGDAGGIGFRQTQDFLPLMEADRRGELKVRNRYQFRPTGDTFLPDAPNQVGVNALRSILSAAPLAESRECVGPIELPGEGFHLSRAGSPYFRNMGLGESIASPIPEQIAEAVIFLLRRPDWSFHQHAEAGQISNIIEGIQSALVVDDPCRIEPLATRHSSLEHLNDATKQNLADLAELGVGAGIQAVRFLFPGWQYSGPPYKAAVDTPALNAGFGADGMFAAHGNPWTTLQFMVTGETFNGEDILTDDPLGRGPQQITLMEGLRGYSRDAAWFTREEHERGQLKVGYLADVIVLEQDPFEVDVREIRDTKAALTIVDGEVVYTSGSL